ncbi:hypothetical protein HK405_000336, partial [Cladochytrium tenue]
MSRPAAVATARAAGSAAGAAVLAVGGLWAWSYGWYARHVQSATALEAAPLRFRQHALGNSSNSSSSGGSGSSAHMAAPTWGFYERRLDAPASGGDGGPAIAAAAAAARDELLERLVRAALSSRAYALERRLSGVPADQRVPRLFPQPADGRGGGGEEAGGADGDNGAFAFAFGNLALAERPAPGEAVLRYSAPGFDVLLYFRAAPAPNNAAARRVGGGGGGGGGGG